MTSTEKTSQKMLETGRGPIARKVINIINQFRQRKVLNFSDWHQAKLIAEEADKQCREKLEAADDDPLHRIHAYAQNKMSSLVEFLCELPQCQKLTQIIAEAEDEYMPSWPPMSPISNSHFYTWATNDVFAGPKKETFATVIIDVCRRLKVDPVLIELFEIQSASRLGVYFVEQCDDRFVHLNEIMTGNRIKAITTGYAGKPGELWLTRLLPPPAKIAGFDYAVVFTSPYILNYHARDRDMQFAMANAWVQYMERSISKVPLNTVKDSKERYHWLMKAGFHNNYWNEFIFLAYAGHTDTMIGLNGIPDVATTLPHATMDRYKEDRCLT